MNEAEQSGAAGAGSLAGESGDDLPFDAEEGDDQDDEAEENLARERERERERDRETDRDRESDASASQVEREAIDIKVLMKTGTWKDSTSDWLREVEINPSPLTVARLLSLLHSLRGMHDLADDDVFLLAVGKSSQFEPNVLSQANLDANLQHLDELVSCSFTTDTVCFASAWVWILIVCSSNHFGVGSLIGNF
jgi:hypothetical protein